MKCERVRTLLPAYLDGELDLLTSLELEEHLPACAACSQLYTEMRDLQSTLSANRLALFTPAPPDLEARVRAALQATDHNVAVGARRESKTSAHPSPHSLAPTGRDSSHLDSASAGQNRARLPRHES
jgi:anti-sigma factor RsiW